jgi:transcriptional regulator with XRE-family HTH domain
LNVRYTLKSLDWFKWCMKNPGRGAPYSVRTLAEATGLSIPQVGRLHAGELNDLDVNDAHSVAEALGVAILTLFAPPPSPKQNETSTNASIKKE